MRFKSLFTATASSVLLAVCVCSCADKTKLSASAIAKQAKAELNKQAISTIWTKFQVGTYECNDAESRLVLASLKEAKLIEYSVARYAWWEKSKKWSYYGSHYGYDFRDHYVVTVKLTPKGKGLALDAIPEPQEDTDKDLVSAEYDASKYVWGKKDLSEDWPVIANPFVEPAELEGEESSLDDESAAAHKGTSKTKKSTPKKSDNGAELSDSLAYKAYHALNLEDPQYEILKLGKVQVVKVRNIQITDLMSKAKAEAIVATTDVNDAGRILRHLENGFRDTMDVYLTYYADKGWVVTKVTE
ncbi:MAG: hypothetical protein IJS62_08380 [Bacteroidales bacterium]|nr:hypothetical protein [Bacteroidales bacterium]